MAEPRVSVLIPTLQAERWLGPLLDVLERQRVAGGHELVVVDSDSTDRTRSLLEDRGARVERIPRAEFGHGRTRNRLAELARGEALVFLSQDALPEGEDFLAHLVAPLAGERVAGVTARVLPHADDDPLTARTVLDAPEAAAEARIWDADDLARGPVRFNDVASAMRAEVWRAIPFPDVEFGEDVAWAEAAVGAGWRVAFEPRAVVRHAHAYRAGEAFRRYRTDARFLLDQRGLRVRPGPLSCLRGWLHELRADWRFVAARGHGWSHLLRAPVLRGAQVLGQWYGSTRRGSGGHGSGEKARG